ncbi:nuclear transport factor 2 family protein [Streptomyces sp. NPDC050610]|uniref:nuclear transport factor 2 family protein n=1 Tax=Streptomyces sp. NPDC050610 TaxID=3157097 RepID=UPI00344A167A
MTDTTPAAVFRHGLDLLVAGDIDAWVDLWADHGVLEFPLAQPGAPRRLDGKAAVHAYMAAFPDLVDITGFPYVEVHRSERPEVVIVEMRAEGRALATDRPYEMTYIAVVTVENGLITHYRDYWSPLAAAEIAGGKDAPWSGTPSSAERR